MRIGVKHVRVLMSQCVSVCVLCILDRLKKKLQKGHQFKTFARCICRSRNISWRAINRYSFIVFRSMWSSSLFFFSCSATPLVGYIVYKCKRFFYGWIMSFVFFTILFIFIFSLVRIFSSSFNWQQWLRDISRWWYVLSGDARRLCVIAFPPIRSKRDVIWMHFSTATSSAQCHN